MTENKKTNTKKASLILEAIKTGLKYIAIGVAVIGGLFLLTKPPVLLMILRLGVPVLAIGAVGYGTVSLVKSIFRPRNKNSKNKEEKTYSTSLNNNKHKMSRRVIRRRKKDVDFNKNAKPSVEQDNKPQLPNANNGKDNNTPKNQ